MAFGSLTLLPGVNVESTPTLNQAAISAANMIRWKMGLPEKIGGWELYFPNPIGSIVRDMHAWQGLSQDTHLAVGAVSSLDIISDGVIKDVTPQTTTTNSAPDFSTINGSSTVTIVDPNILNPTTNNSVFIATPISVGGLILFGLYRIQTIISPTSYTINAGSNATATVNNGGAVPAFTTTNGSASISVAFNAHGEAIGDSVFYLVSTTVGGITIFGQYLVQTVPTANSYTVNASSQATSAATVSMNAGLAQFTYYIAIGPQATSAGYGTGTYGTGGYGTGIAPPTGAGTPITSTDWTFDNWGEILLACPENGPIYTWSPDSGFETAVIIEQAPILNGGIFIAMPQQILVAWGASVSGFPEPLQIRWSDSQDFTDWSPSSQDFAGGFKIPTGSKIVGGIQAPQQALIWTDIDVWSMQYVGQPLVFGFNKLMTGCGLLSSHAATVLGGTTFWMSDSQFFALPAGGGPRSIPCPVWDVVFQNLNKAFVHNIRAGANSTFNEVWWHYPSTASTSGENDSYVKVTLDGQGPVWDYGALPTGRTAWIDQSVLGTAIGADPTGRLFQHEIGYDGNGVALNPFFKTGYFVIAEGEPFAVLDQILPDFKYGLLGGPQTANVLITIYVVDYPNGTVTTAGPYNVNQAMNYISTRIRGRQTAFRIESQDAGSFWRLGKLRYRFAEDGRR